MNADVDATRDAETLAATVAALVQFVREAQIAGRPWKSEYHIEGDENGHLTGRKEFRVIVQPS